MLDGGSFRESSVRYVNCNLVRRISSHETFGTQGAFVSLNSIEILQDTGSTNSLLDGQRGMIRFKSVKKIGDHAIAVASYIIVDTDAVPSVSAKNGIGHVFVRDSLLQQFRVADDWKSYMIHPLSDLETLYPQHIRIWDMLDE